MKKTVIKVLNREHGKKVIEYFRSKGVNIRSGWSGCVTLESHGENGYIYYGVNEYNTVDNYSIKKVTSSNFDIITLPGEEVIYEIY